MRRMIAYDTRWTSRSTDWLVSMVFLLTGILIIALVPPILRQGPGRETMVTFVQMLGGSLALIGTAILLWVLGGVFLQVYYPEYTDLWYYWGKLISGAVLALLFGLPATLAFPVVFLAYQVRPNLIFPVETNPMTLYLLGMFISAIGVSFLWLSFTVLSSKYRQRVSRLRTRV